MDYCSFHPSNCLFVYITFSRKQLKLLVLQNEWFYTVAKKNAAPQTCQNNFMNRE